MGLIKWVAWLFHWSYYLGYLEAESVSFQNLVWLHQLPLVNVEIRWANSMGFVTEVRVAGQITATLDGSISATKTQQKETVIDSHLNPT